MAFRTRTTETIIDGYTLQQGDKAIFKPLADINERMENIHYDPEMKKFFDGKTEFTVSEVDGAGDFRIEEDNARNGIFQMWYSPEWVLKVIPASSTIGSTRLPIEGNLEDGVKVIFKKYEDCEDKSPGLVSDLMPFLDGKSVFTITNFSDDKFFMLEEDDENWAFCAAWVKEIVTDPSPEAPKATPEEFTFDNLKVGDLVVLKPLAEQSSGGQRKGDPYAPDDAYDGKTPVKVIGKHMGQFDMPFVQLEYPNGYRQERDSRAIFFDRLQGWYVDGAKDVTPAEEGIGIMKLAPGKKYILKSQAECEDADEGTGVMYDMPFGKVVTVSGSICPIAGGYQCHIKEDGGKWWYFDKWLEPLNEGPAEEEEEEAATPSSVKKGDKVILKHRDGVFQMWYSQEWILRKVDPAENAAAADEAPAQPLTLDALRGLDGEDVDKLLINHFPGAKAIVLKTLDSDNPYLMFIPVDFLSEEGIWEYEVGDEALGENWGNYKYYAGDLGTRAEGCSNTELHSYRCKYLYSDEVQDALDTIKSISAKATVDFDQFVAGVA